MVRSFFWSVLSGLALAVPSGLLAQDVAFDDPVWAQATDYLCLSDDDNHLERRADVVIKDIGIANIESSANKRNPVALFLRGLGKYRGLGGFQSSLADVSKDLKRAADAGHPLAMGYYAMQVAPANDLTGRLRWLERAAGSGCYQARMSYAVMLISNQLTTSREIRDRLASQRKGLALLNMLADEGYASSQYILGTFLRNGDFGIPKDTRRGMGLISAAADDGLPIAMNTLAYSYLHGKDIGKDPQKAIAILLDMAEKGDTQRYAELGEYYLDGTLIPRNVEKATEYFELAKQKGAPPSSAQLAKLQALQASSVRTSASAGATGSPLETVWTKLYGRPVRPVTIRAMAPLPDRSSILLGYVGDHSTRAVRYHATRVGAPPSTLGWIGKIDATGELVWQKTTQDLRLTNVADIVALADGGFIAVGQKSNGTTELLGRTVPNPYDLDGWILRFDAEGNLLWEKTIDAQNNADSRFTAIARHPDGGFVLAGRAKPKLPGKDSHGAPRGWLVKLDSNGKPVWNKVFGEDKIWNEVNSVAVLADNGIVAVGYARDGGWIFKVSPDGREVWSRRLGGRGNVGFSRAASFNSVVSLPDGSFVVAGNILTKGAGSLDGWLVKLDGAGRTLWDQTYGSKTLDEFETVLVGSDGALYAAGNTRSGPSTGQESWLVKVGPDGRMLSDKRIARPEEGFAFPEANRSTIIDLENHADGGVLVLHETGYGSFMRGWLTEAVR